MLWDMERFRPGQIKRKIVHSSTQLYESDVDNSVDNSICNFKVLI
ncbi:hypothetical protein [Clostridium estertheticum]|nr:hypothetical protein [Clostridium estertheticum]